MTKYVQDYHNFIEVVNKIKTDTVSAARVSHLGNVRMVDVSGGCGDHQNAFDSICIDMVKVLAEQYNVVLSVIQDVDGLTAVENGTPLPYIKNLSIDPHVINDMQTLAEIVEDHMDPFIRAVINVYGYVVGINYRAHNRGSAIWAWNDTSVVIADNQRTDIIEVVHIASELIGTCIELRTRELIERQKDW